MADPPPCGDGWEHKILADAGDEEHEAMVMWMGLEHASQFDPAAFDIERVNRELRAVGSPR